MSRLVWNGTDWEEAGSFYARKYAEVRPSFTIMADRTNYRSVVDGTQITSRSGHRAHLKAHGVEEVGSQAPAWIDDRRYMRKHGASKGDIAAHEAQRQVDTPGVSFQYGAVDHGVTNG